MKTKWILLIQVILLIAGIEMGEGEDITTPTKIIISALFVMTALYYLKSNKSVYNKFIAPAMLFCFIGDIATSELLPGGLITAMLFFGIGHFCFIIGYFKTVKVNTEKFPKKSFVIVGIIYYILFLIIWFIFIIPTENGAFFVIAALVYGTIASTMATIAFSLAKVKELFRPAAAGAALFWISDVMIAINQTNDIYRLPVAIIITYFSALGLIIYTGQRKEHCEELTN